MRANLAVMLGLVPSIHVLNTTCIGEDVDGRHKGDHDGRQGGVAGQASPAFRDRQSPTPENRFQTMAKKTPEQLAQEFEGRKAKGLAKGGAAYWPNIIANAVLKLTAARAEISPETLIEMIEREAPTLEITVRSGATEAVARLKQAIAKGA